MSCGVSVRRARPARTTRAVPAPHQRGVSQDSIPPLEESLKFGLFAHGKLSIQIKIEFEHVYARFAEEAKLPSLSMLCHESPKLIDRYPSRLRHARQLKLG